MKKTAKYSIITDMDKKKKMLLITTTAMVVLGIGVVVGAVLARNGSLLQDKPIRGVDCMPLVPQETLDCLDKGECECVTY